MKTLTLLALLCLPAMAGASSPIPLMVGDALLGPDLGLLEERCAIDGVTSPELYLDFYGAVPFNDLQIGTKVPQQKGDPHGGEAPVPVGTGGELSGNENSTGQLSN